MTPATNPTATAPNPTILPVAAFVVAAGAPVPVGVPDALAVLPPLITDVAADVAATEPDDVGAVVGISEMVTPA